VTNLEPEGFVYPDPVAVCLDILRVPEPKTVKNRVHIDLATTSVAHGALIPARMPLFPRYSRSGAGRRGWLPHDCGSFTALFAGNDP
jgi:hypothetical protein